MSRKKPKNRTLIGTENAREKVKSWYGEPVAQKRKKGAPQMTVHLADTAYFTTCALLAYEVRVIGETITTDLASVTCAACLGAR
jgi:hypothetical protein